MPVFVVAEPRQTSRLFELESEQIIIGRSTETDLCLPNVSVSRQHARVTIDDQSVTIEDLDSNNGVLVNGTQIKQQAIKHGDLIKIGKYKLQFLIEGEMSTSQRLMAQTLLPYSQALVVSGSHSTHRISPAMRKKLAAAEHRRKHARVLMANDPSQRWRPGTDPLTIGPGGKVPIPVFLARSPVAVIEWNGVGHVLRKLAFFAKVTVNGSAPEEGRTLDDGDDIRVGRVRLKYQYRSPSDKR